LAELKRQKAKFETYVATAEGRIAALEAAVAALQSH